MENSKITGISEHCLSLTQESEGCSLTAYPDPGTSAAPWTIGWGNTHPVDGVLVHQGMTITQAVADAMLKAELDKGFEGQWNENVR